MKKFKTFEYIVIVLLVLAIIWIVFYGWKNFSQNKAIDSNLMDMQVTLDKYKQLHGTYPESEWGFNIIYNGKFMWIQWTISKRIQEELFISLKNSDKYTYNTNAEKTKYQIAFVDNGQIKTIWNKLWILLDKNSNPIKQTSSVEIATLKDYKIYIEPNNVLAGNEQNAKTLNWFYNYDVSCKEYLKSNSNLKWKDGVYKIQPIWYTWEAFNVYCDMTSDDGWWTVATMLAGGKNNSLFKTKNTEKIISLSENIYSKWQITDIWTDNSDKDIMIKCFLASNNQSNYIEPLVVYGFKKADIANLTKDEFSKIVKIWTGWAETGSTATEILTWETFASIELQYDFKGETKFLSKQYGSSSKSNSLILMTNDTTEPRAVFSLYKGYQLSCSPKNQKWSPAYCEVEESPIELTDATKNYCITAIR